MRKIIKKYIHHLIAQYLNKCGKVFHTYHYGASGRYVVIMNETEYHEYSMRVQGITGGK